MRVRDLISMLQKFKPDLEVVLVSDETNEFYVVERVVLGNYNSTKCQFIDEGNPVNAITLYTFTE